MKNIMNKLIAIFIMFQMACGSVDPMRPNTNPWRERYRADDGSTAAYKIDLVNSEIEIPLHINLASLTTTQRAALNQALTTGDYNFATQFDFSCEYDRAPNVRMGVGYGALGPRDSNFSLSQGRIYFDANGNLYNLVKFLPRRDGKVWYNSWGNDTTGELVACLTERTNPFVYQSVLITNGTNSQRFEFTGTSTIYFNPLP